MGDGWTGRERLSNGRSGGNTGRGGLAGWRAGWQWQAGGRGDRRSTSQAAAPTLNSGHYYWSTVGSRKTWALAGTGSWAAADQFSGHCHCWEPRQPSRFGPRSVSIPLSSNAFWCQRRLLYGTWAAPMTPLRLPKRVGGPDRVRQDHRHGPRPGSPRAKIALGGHTGPGWTAWHSWLGTQWFYHLARTDILVRHHHSPARLRCPLYVSISAQPNNTKREMDWIINRGETAARSALTPLHLQVIVSSTVMSWQQGCTTGCTHDPTARFFAPPCLPPTLPGHHINTSQLPCLDPKPSLSSKYILL